MPYPTPLLDKAIANRRQQNEQQRLIMIEQVIRWLESKAQNYGITQAYLFGSVVRPYGFGCYSDIDLALGVRPLVDKSCCNQGSTGNPY
jgi:hypothetical protein